MKSSIIDVSSILKAIVVSNFCIFVFSFDFHSLWLFYDISLITLSIVLLTTGNFVFQPLSFFSFFLALFYFLTISIVNGHFFIGMLATWDIFKHVILIIGINGYATVRASKTALFPIGKFEKFLLLSFGVQAILIVYQFLSNFYYDDIAGSFGRGASHAVAYMSIINTYCNKR